MRSKFIALTWLGFFCALLLDTRVQADSDVKAELYVVEWRASAWGEQVAGSACWLLGSESELRAEVSRDLSTRPLDLTERLQRLFHRQGDGWTVTIAGHTEGTGTWQPWGEEWRVAEPRLLTWLRILTTALVQGPNLELTEEWGEAELVSLPQPVANRPRWLSKRSQTEQLVDKLLVQIPSPYPGGWDLATTSRQEHPNNPFQARMVQRGLGRGSDQEIVILHWDCHKTETGQVGLQVGSTRRQGQLKITLPAAIPVRYPAPESFLTLWSLADLAVEVPSVLDWEKSD